MSQLVTDEDGTQHSFPDDATPAEMNAALGAKQPPVDPTAIADPGLSYKLSPDPHAYFFSGIGQAGRNVANTLSAHITGTPASWTQASKDWETSPAGTSLMGKLGETTGEGLIEAGPLAMASEGMSLLGPVGRFAAGRLGAGASGLTKLLSSATAGGVYGAGANTLVGRDPVAGAEAGALLGGAAGAPDAAMQGFASGVSPEMAGLANWAKAHGIDVNGPQMRAAAAASAAGKVGRGVPARTPEQAQQVTEALANVVGAVDSEGKPAAVLTKGAGGTLDSTFDNIGKGFDSIADRITNAGGVPLDSQFVGKLQSIWHEAEQNFPPTDPGLALLRKQIDNLGNWQTPNTTLNVNGAEWRNLTGSRSVLGKMARDSNSNVQQYAQDIRESLHDAMGRAMAQSDPAVAADLGELSRRYKDMLAVEPVVQQAGEDGVVDPARLLGAVAKKYKDYASTGAGDIGQVAETGKQFLATPPPVQRADGANPLVDAAVHAVRHGVLPLTGVGIGLHEFPMATIGGALGYGALKGAQAATGAVQRSDPYANLLMRIALQGPRAMDPRLAPLMGFTGSQLTGGQ